MGNPAEKALKPKAVTLAVVAKHAQVHVSTASRALSEDPSGVGADTVQRIRDLARLLGYRRDEGAAGLRTGHSLLIGVLVPRLTDIVLATMYEGLDDAAVAAGYGTVVANTLDDPLRRRIRLDALLARRIDGVIIGDSHVGDTLAAELRSLNVPCVLVMRHLPGEVSVTTDDILGGRLAGEHLLSLGHRQVGVIAGDVTASTGIERLAGFKAAYERAGMDVPAANIVHSGFGAAAGYEACAQLLTLPDRPTAIFAADDLTAIGAMGAIRETGLRLGQDVALVGYNDIEISSRLPIPLTSVRSPLLEMGRSSVGKLLEQIGGQQTSSEKLTPELIVRATTDPRAR